MPEYQPLVVAPTYNNAKTLGAVVTAVRAQGLPILVVNDGATDDTARILKTLAQDDEHLTVLTHPHNQGKGAALATGIKHALAHGFTHAATLDTDGQHEPEDLPALLQAAKARPDALVIGQRPARPQHCPAYRRLGWYASRRAIRWLIQDHPAGKQVTDTQSGMRVYPLQLFEQCPGLSRGYGFETQALVHAAWARRPILERKIHCRYHTGDDNVSHFRPALDSLAIAWLLLGLAAQHRRRRGIGPLLLNRLPLVPLMVFLLLGHRAAPDAVRWPQAFMAAGPLALLALGWMRLQRVRITGVDAGLGLFLTTGSLAVWLDLQPIREVLRAYRHVTLFALVALTWTALWAHRLLKQHARPPHAMLVAAWLAAAISIAIPPEPSSSVALLFIALIIAQAKLAGGAATPNASTVFNHTPPTGATPCPQPTKRPQPTAHLQPTARPQPSTLPPPSTCPRPSSASSPAP